MRNYPLTLHTFPHAILHIDGDAFFASCEQARDPSLQGKPVITGKERGIASSMSYEAKARGVTRGMRGSEIKKICPDAVFIPSDYETYSLLSSRFFSIVRRYTPDVEEYGIDECFADITGLRRVHRTSYAKIAEMIKNDIDTELGFTFSIGLGPNKVVSKIGSKWEKPSGLTVIPGKEIHIFLKDLPVEKLWGIGPSTTAFLNKYNIQTALEFAEQHEKWIHGKLSKPFIEIWQELNGKHILPLETKKKSSYASIQKIKTFTPPSNDRQFVFSQLAKNVENACMKARRYNLEAKEVVFFLRTQDFKDTGLRLRFAKRTSFPNEIIKEINTVFDDVFDSKKEYRSTGAWLIKLKEEEVKQLDLFGTHQHVEKMSKLFKSMDEIRSKYGKHTLFLGSSFGANKFGQHLGDRGDAPQRKSDLLPGETSRKRLGIPMFTGKIS
jgi:nucleotidyltransferase/DNA polymerase involved in DNA repair